MTDGEAHVSDGGRPEQRRGLGCLMPLSWWVLLLILYFNFGLPPPVNAPIGDQDARRFYIAMVERGARDVSYSRSTLQVYRAGGADMAGRDYRLPVGSVTIEDGDIDRVTVLDDENGVQRIEFVHNNSALVASIYRAGPSGIEPESLRVIGNVGSGLIALALIFPAYFLSWATRRLALRSARD